MLRQIDSNHRCGCFFSSHLRSDRLNSTMWKPRIQAKSLEGVETPREVFNWHLLVLTIVSSCGGVIFGYDLAFVSGVFSLPSFLSRFNLNATTSQLLQTNVLATFQGGCFFGCIFCYWFNEKYGRRAALIVAGILFDAGVIMQLAAMGHRGTFYAGRIFSGFGVGGSTFVVPQYLSENAPAVARGGIIGCVRYLHLPASDVKLTSCAACSSKSGSKWAQSPASGSTLVSMSM